VPGVLVNPLENFAVAFAGCELLAQRFRIEAEEIDDVLVERTVVMELAAHPGDFGAAFIEHTRQDCVSAKA
jgi:hypothetical protein